MRHWKIIFVVSAICASAWLMFLIDDGLDIGWPQNVVRNWQQFGFFNLHGKLAQNPGGFDILANPQVYKGMSPACLYAPFLTMTVFNWTGLGALSFHALLAAAVVWGAWNLLGRNHFALIVAVAGILCPGYMRWQRLLDPNTLSVLPVIPYAAIVMAILRKSKLTPASIFGFFVLTVAFMSLNWTTAWVCAPCILLLLGMPGVNRRALFFFAAAIIIGVPIVVGASLIAKAGGGATGINPAKPSQLLGSYLWGNIGYGQGLTTGKAFVRLAFVNGIGLFPLWIALFYVVASRSRNGAKLSWLMFAPLALTIADIVIMRNYFAHHPWMAGPVLLVGLIFTLALLRVPTTENPEGVSEKIPFKFVPAIALLCFIYGFAVLAFFRANETNLLSLAGLVRHHTTRSDTIAVVKNSDPATALVAGRLDEQLDRRVIVMDDFKDLAAETNHYVILSSVRLDDSFALAAQSSTTSQSRLNKVADWFNHSVARRNPGDRLELAGTYFLYEPKP